MRAPAAAAILLLLLLAGLAACGAIARYDVDGQRALARVEKQVGFGPRLPGTPAHAACRAWLVAELERLGARVESQRFVDSTLGRPLELVNVIGHYPGRGSGRRIVLGSHYDSRPWCDQDPDTAWRDRPVPGANDGGSSVAVLLEVAELLHRRAAPVDVDLVFFDGEDQGRPTTGAEFCLGSRGYAARLGGNPPTAAFVFDMVGDRDLGIWDEGFSAERASNLVEIVADAARATAARHFHRGVGYHVYDDHMRLLDAGIPAIDIIDFEYGAWHTHRDLPDQISAASLAEVARVAAWLVYASPIAR